MSARAGAGGQPTREIQSWWLAFAEFDGRIRLWCGMRLGYCIPIPTRNLPDDVRMYCGVRSDDYVRDVSWERICESLGVPFPCGFAIGLVEISMRKASSS